MLSQNSKKPPHLLLKANLDGASLWEELLESRAQLRALGFHGVEVAIGSRGDTEFDTRTMTDLLEWVKPWHDAGLCVYVHPYTAGPANPAQCIAEDGGVPHTAFQRVADTAAILAERGQAPVVLTYHAAEAAKKWFGRDPRSLRVELLRRSVHFFGLGFKHLESFAGAVRLVSETQLPARLREPLVRIGDRPEEVLATLGEQEEGVCWDTGHYLLGVEWHGLSLQPPSQFLQRVCHMHLHEVVNQVDHRPLGRDSHRVAGCVALASFKHPSITLEYDYLEACGRNRATREQLLTHLAEVRDLILAWSHQEQPSSSPP